MCVVCMSIFSNISDETTEPIETKFHMKPPWDGETKICSNGPGHMTQMASMPIYGKHFKIISGTKRPITLKLDMQHRVFECYQVCQMMTLG